MVQASASHLSCALLGQQYKNACIIQINGKKTFYLQEIPIRLPDPQTPCLISLVFHQFWFMYPEDIMPIKYAAVITKMIFIGVCI